MPTIDAGHRGGFRSGRRVFVAGAPGAGKTTLVINWAVDWARGGTPTVILACDESVEELLIRIGQMLGLDRDALERAEVATLDRLRAELNGIPMLQILDGDDGATVETAVDAATAAAAKAGVVVVDSIQTARAAGTDEATSPRARIDAVVIAIRRASRQGVTMVVTSEVSRGAYRQRDPSERIEDLAAAKESGSIEYAAQTLLVLRPVPDRTGEIDVAVAKNRGGDRAPMRLVLDFARARAVETVRPAGEAEPGDQLAADMEHVREVLRKHPGIAGQEALVAQLGMQAARGRRAVKAVTDAGEIRIERKGTARRLFLDETRPTRPESSKSSGTSDSETRPTRPPPIGRTSRDETSQGVDERANSSEREPGEDDDV
jgi:KaiC/GvpD/RAD55 family RecA-like ATPase